MVDLLSPGLGSSCCWLLALAAGVGLWLCAMRGNRAAALWGGIVAGLMLARPELGGLLAIVMMLTVGKRAVIGVLVSGLTLVGLSIWLPKLADSFGMGWYLAGASGWESQPTFRAFWRLAVQGHGAGRTRQLTAVLWGLSSVGLASYLLSAVGRHVRRVQAGFEGFSPGRLIAATLVSAPLLMPVFSIQDLVLLGVPMALMAVEWKSRRKFGRGDAYLAALWLGLGVSFLLAGWASARFRVQLPAGALTCLALLHIARVFQQEPIRQELPKTGTGGEGEWSLAA